MDLLKVSRPLRYAGGEPGMIDKDPAGKLRFCLVFPDVYEIGMSHLGYKILYTRLNESENIYCERFFAPWPDGWEVFGRDIMVSLEKHHPVAAFDVVGFSFQYEMAYTTALQLLARAGIALKSAERGENEPLIVAGGCCMLNPAPLSDFIDVFFLGEMEGELVSAMEKLRELRNNGASRREQLEFLNSFTFTYVPQVEPDKRALRSVYLDFSTDKSETAPLVPLMPAVQDRAVVEISRGCTNGCRFCQAGMIYRPVREKAVSNLCDQGLKAIANTGYQEISLLSLDSGDFTQIEPLLDKMGSELSSRNVSLALPSLRAETVNPVLLEKLGAVRKGGFTIAPEAGTQRLRDVINKNLTEDEIIKAAVYAKNAGYNGAKLYFMCGLPYETDEDILGIADLIRKIRSEVKGGRFEITLSLSNFVPKPHTPFERHGQDSIEELRRKHSLLREELKKERVKIRCHDATTSAIEAAIARGGRELAAVFTEAANRGFYLDAWTEFFSRDKWLSLFEDCGMPVEAIAGKVYADDEPLPWDVVDCGIKPSWLLKERDRAKIAATTDDCRKGNCSACGVCDFKTVKNIDAPAEDYQLDLYRFDETAHKRYELIYSRHGVAALMSALDGARIFSHMLLSSGADLKYTEGFNPQPRLVLPAPLPVGVGGERESLLFEAYKLPDDLLARLNAIAPAGMRVLSVKEAVWPKNLSDFTMIFAFDADSFSFLEKAVTDGKAYYDKLDKKGRPKTVDLKEYLIKIDNANRCVEVSVTNRGGFHFPEFFRKAGYEGQPQITRISYKNNSPQ